MAEPQEGDTEKEGNQEDNMAILSRLEKRKMFELEREFSTKEKGLSLDEFVEVMLNNLALSINSEDDRLRLTTQLIDLFREIDVNGDATMEWDEFSNYIIELGMLRQDRTFRTVVKDYKLSSNIVDKDKHENEIEKLYYFEKIKSLFVLERDSPRFKVYNASTGELYCDSKAHKGAILAADIMPEYNLIATSSNDLTIHFWDTSSFTLRQILSTPEIQLSIKYANWNNANLLYTGGSDAVIHVYDATTMQEKCTLSGWNPFFKKDIQQYGHAGPISDILPIYSHMTLVTSGLCGKICLWDIPTHTFKKELVGHNKGVCSLDWSSYSTMSQCLISAGLDHEAMVWNTYVKERIYTLRGHNHPLVGVKCLPNSPQIVTADISGMVKVWDVRNFFPVQTFNAPVDELNAFTLTHPKKRIVLASRNMVFYEYNEPKDQLLTDEKMCLKVLYDKVLFYFITLHPDCVKVWDAKTGRLQSVHRELSQNELTCCILDKRQRKLFVGDSQGKMFTVNVKNGAKMKKFEKHEGIVNDLQYWTSDSIENTKDNDLRRIISASRDNMIFIHDEDSTDPHKSVRYYMRQHKKSCNCTYIKKGSEIFASCSDDGMVVLTNLMTYRQEVIYRHLYELKKILFLDPFECIITADSHGNILFLGGPYSMIKNKLIMEKQYLASSVSNNMEPFPVSAIDFHPFSRQLILGDEFGNVTVWDLTKLILKLEEFVFHEKIPNKYQKYYEKLIEDTQEESKRNFRNEKKSTFFATEIGEFDKSNKKGETAKDFNVHNFDEERLKVFKISDIEEKIQIKNAHQDGITSIEVIKNQDCFITSSFDCCSYVWSMQTWRKCGSLILGGDKNWGFKIKEEERKSALLDEAIEMLKMMDGKKKPLSEKDEILDEIPKTDDDLRNERKKEVYEKAKAALSTIEKLKNNNWRSEIDFEKDSKFEGEENDDSDNDYDILNELDDNWKSSNNQQFIYTTKSSFKSKSQKMRHKFKIN